MTRHNTNSAHKKMPRTRRGKLENLCGVEGKRPRAWCNSRRPAETPDPEVGGLRHTCVVADSKYPGMWRPTLSGGRLGDMANLAWAKNAVLAAAERELEWEARQRAAMTPPKCPEKGGVFEGSAPPIAQNKRGRP